ncbi:MAG TPA: hypothetical protein VFD42_04195 [Chloroflexota bacterium]|nr:hypothetical protein [Chloroflexota bacterium]
MHDRDMNLYEMEDRSSGILRALENMPTQAYLGFAFGSMVVSAFFFLIGRHSVANFIGQWVPSIGMLALVYKLLRPSQEGSIDQMKETFDEEKSTAGRMTGRSSM